MKGGRAKQVQVPVGGAEEGGERIRKKINLDLMAN